MRPLEALLAGLLALSALFLFISPARRYRWVHLLQPSVIFVMALQLVLEGYRWQLVPLYSIAAVLVLVAAPNFRLVKVRQTESNSTKRRSPRPLTAMLSLLAIALAAALPVLFPHLRLPRPSGPYAVGTTNLNFLDEHRPETFTSDPNDCRELFARVWYPAENPGGTKPVSYCENAHEVSLDDDRCKAGVNMDGLQLGGMLDKDLKRPFLFMHHDNVEAANKTPNLLFFERAKAPVYLMTIDGTGHLSFTDVSLYGRASLFRLMAPVGKLDGERCQRIVGDCLLAFLDRHLRGDNSRFLNEVCSRYPEVELRMRNPDGEK